MSGPPFVSLSLLSCKTENVEEGSARKLMRSLSCPFCYFPLLGAVFLKLAGPSLVQMYIGDGAKVRSILNVLVTVTKSRVHN